jgi:hypothetical protein
MSIATLKKKTFAQYNNMSVNSKNGFSLNGTHRSQGYVGQNVISRSLPRTLMKGDTIKGHGGCCGFYPMHSIIESSVNSQEDPNIVKSSVLTNSGMIASKYRWIRRGPPYTSVKPDNTLNSNTQQYHVDRVKKNAINNAKACEIKGATIKTYSCKDIGIHKTPHTDTRVCSNITKSLYADLSGNTLHKYVAMSNSEYILRLNSKCTIRDVVNIPNGIANTPINICGS